MNTKTIKVRFIIDDQALHDLAVIYFEKGRPVAFKRIRFEIHPSPSTGTLKDELCVIQHQIATAMRYRPVNVKKLRLKEVI